MNKPIKIKYYQDPGHGWFAVKRMLLIDLGVEKHVSQYSYQRGSMVYLEEDCDGALLFKALQDRGIPYQVEDRHSNSRSKIRSYDQFFPFTVIQFAFTGV